MSIGESKYMTHRHHKLATRPRCPETWKTKHNDEAHTEHRCRVFSGHVMSRHMCECGSTREWGQGEKER